MELPPRPLFKTSYYKCRVVVETKNSKKRIPELLPTIFKQFPDIYELSINAPIDIADFNMIMKSNVSVVQFGEFSLRFLTSGISPQKIEQPGTIKKKIIFYCCKPETVKCFLKLNIENVSIRYLLGVSLCFRAENLLDLGKPLSMNVGLRTLKLSVYNTITHVMDHVCDTICHDVFKFLENCPKGTKIELHFYGTSMCETMGETIREISKRRHLRIYVTYSFYRKSLLAMIKDGTIHGVRSGHGISGLLSNRSELESKRFKEFLNLGEGQNAVPTNIRHILFKRLTAEYIDKILTHGILKNLKSLVVEHIYLEDFIRLSNFHEHFPHLKFISISFLGLPAQGVDYSTCVINPKFQLETLSISSAGWYPNQKTMIAKVCWESMAKGWKCRYLDAETPPEFKQQLEDGKFGWFLGESKYQQFNLPQHVAANLQRYDDYRKSLTTLLAVRKFRRNQSSNPLMILDISTIRIISQFVYMQRGEV